MNEYKMDNKSKILHIVIISILLIVVEIILYYYLYNEKNAIIPAVENNTVKEISLQNISGICLMAGLMLSYCAYSFIYLSVLYNSTIYAINDDLIIAEKGVLFRKKKVMKISAMQYMKTVSFPFAEFFGLNFILFNGYGNRLVFTFISQNDVYEITEIVRKFSVQKYHPEDGNGKKEL